MGDDIFTDVVKEVVVAIVVTALTGVGALVATRIPQFKRKYEKREFIFPIVTALLIAMVMSGAMGVILRHATREQLKELTTKTNQELASLRQSSFSLVASGRISKTGEPNKTYSGVGYFVSNKIERDNNDPPGLYSVTLLRNENPDARQDLPDIPTIYVGPVRDDQRVSVKVVTVHTSSFVVERQREGKAEDGEFWFAVFKTGQSSAPSVQNDGKVSTKSSTQASTR